MVFGGKTSRQIPLDARKAIDLPDRRSHDSALRSNADKLFFSRRRGRPLDVPIVCSDSLHTMENRETGRRGRRPLRGYILHYLIKTTCHSITSSVKSRNRHLSQVTVFRYMDCKRKIAGYSTSNLYPTPQTVLRLQLASTFSSFSRRRLTWTSTVRLSPK